MRSAGRKSDRQVAIAGGLRTPFAKAGGAYADIHPADLLGTVLSALNIVDVDQVLIGCTQQGGDRVLQHRPKRLAGRRPSDRGTRDHDRHRVRLLAADRQPGRRARRLRTGRCRRRRRCRIVVPHSDVLQLGRRQSVLPPPA